MKRKQMTSASTFSSEPDTVTESPDAPMGLHVPSGPRLDQAALDSLPQAMPAAFSGDVVLHGEFPQQKQVRVILAQNAIQQIQTHTISDMDREVGGALLGHVCRHQAQTFVEILAAMPAPSSDHGPVHFTFTADTWAHINHAREAEYPDLDIVGWFHTHPDLGVFYSADDVVVHSAAFTLPWQVGLVVDPLRQEACFFGWEIASHGKQILPITGFYEWLDQKPGSLVGWQITNEPFTETSSRVMLAQHVGPGLPPISPWWGVFLGSLSLIISLALLLERLLSAPR